MDISKERGKKASDSLDRYRDLIESIDDWVWEINRDGVYTYASPQVQAILGYHPSEVVGKTPLDLMTPAEAARVRSNFLAILEHPGVFRLIETDHLHKDRRVISINTSGNPFFDQSGAFLGYRGVDRDITEMKRQERQQLFLLRALDQMAEAALIVNDEQKITYVNDSFISLFGYEEPEILGQPLDVLNVALPADNLSTRDSIRTLQSKGIIKCEVLRKKANGDSVPVFLTASAIRDGQHRICGYVGTYSDLTSVKATAQRLEKAYTDVIKSISLTVEQRDPYTFGHQNNVSHLATAIAREMGNDEQFILGLVLGASIHDIGKIHIPAEILNRPGRLTVDEMNMVKTHSQVGFDILKDIDFPWPVAQMVLQHHERLDGSGYPQGLKDGEIIPEAKIIGVADVVEAISSHRPYRPAKGIEPALGEIRMNRGKLYDEAVVDACLKLFENKNFDFKSSPFG